MEVYFYKGDSSLSIFSFLCGAFDTGGVFGGCNIHPHQTLRMSSAEAEEIERSNLELIQEWEREKIKEHYQVHKCLIPPRLNPRWNRYSRYLNVMKGQQPYKAIYVKSDR